MDADSYSVYTVFSRHSYGPESDIVVSYLCNNGVFNNGGFIFLML